VFDIDTVLLPTDGSDCAELAADWAFSVADATDADVHVLSVVDTREYTTDLPGPDDPSEAQRRRLEERAEGAVERAVADHGRDPDAGSTPSTAIGRGVPHEEITGYASENGVDLVVMGTHGRTGLDRYLLGSTAERVVRTADTPVMTIKESVGRFDDRVDDLLLPVDRTFDAERAVGTALDLAAAFDATVHALSVVEIGTLATGFDGASVYDVIDAAEAESERAVDRVAERATAAGLDAESAVVSGDARRGIETYVDDRGIDLVVMGTHGRTGLGRYLLGSVAEATVRTVQAPVVTVRSDDAGDDGRTADGDAENAGVAGDGRDDDGTDDPSEP
jgi:nucleotide-binding universal stress UspA family protein